ncbi:MAG TPA: hypothetical protein VF773_03620 [Verrucomicrobiae bacterium]
MDADSANQALQVIRTLMERSAIYRRALSPIMIFLGILGLVGSVIGAGLQIQSAVPFGLYWMALSFLGVIGAFLLARRQAIKDREQFWSPATKRVAQAVLPSLFVGAVVGFIFTFALGNQLSFSWALPVTWILLYGCALHAAGFFTPRGIRLLGWLFILGGCSLTLSSLAVNVRLAYTQSHLIMGIFFGGLQLAYGIYVHFTDSSSERA